MKSDVFGDLMVWGRVLDQIAELRKSKKLDEHQEGLTRILRYRDNWRLREETLEAIKDLEAPTDELLAQVLEIMMDENVYWQARVLAADALSRLVGKHRQGREASLSVSAAKVIEKMNAILGSRQPPVFHEGIRRFLTAIEKAR